MADLFDYIEWRGDLTFEQSPFNEIDALIFSQVTYAILDGVVSEKFKEQKTLKQLVNDFAVLPDYKQRLKIGFVINERTTEFLFKCAETPRYKDVEISGFRNIFSEKDVEQFAAATYKIGNKVVIAYRGTDDTIIGFEEDFRIAFLDQIPAQKHALEYLEEAIDAFPFSDFILVGHSKGGNLALNTGVNSEKKYRKKIHAIYNFDGPGFNKDFYKKPEYAEIKSRLYSFYPKFSVVGMLFHHPEEYTVIDSDNFGIMQHDAMSWQVTGNKFVTLKEFTDECKFFYATFNNWIDRVSLEERKEFVDSLFSILKAPGYKTNMEVEKNAIQASAKVLTAYAKLDKEKKDAFKDIFVLLMDTVKNELPIFKLASNGRKMLALGE